MAKLTNSDKENITKDLMSGAFTVRELARKYKVANATIQKFKVDSETEQIVNAGIAYKSGLARIENPKLANAVVNAVDEKTKHLLYMHNLTLKNISVMSKKINEDATFDDHKKAQETIGKAMQDLDLVPKTPLVAIQNNNNNNTIKTLQDFYNE